ALQRDKTFKKRKAELTSQFGPDSTEVTVFVAENHPTTGNLVKMEQHRNSAAEVQGEDERQRIKMWSSVFANNQL
ncbi:UNVERIFIED_CONTAM: hypothetical protein HDU68_006544, partial [Siphonaria sp. JEL0065]